MYNEFRSRLAGLADDEYREFCMKGVPCERPFIGVRVPEVRRIVGEISPEEYEEFLLVEPVVIEEVMARGFVVSRLSYDKMMEVFDSQIEYLDNWFTVDTFCAALRKAVKIIWRIFWI